MASPNASTQSPARVCGFPSWAIAVFLFVTTLLVFSPALSDGFVNYDDNHYVTANEHVLAGLNAASIRWAWSAEVASNWHPLTLLSHLADMSLWGQNPRGHHLTSILLHALNAALAFLTLRRLTGAVWTSALCAALFAWHPLRVESVAWIAERKDVLSGFFFFLTLWAYARYIEASGSTSEMGQEVGGVPSPRKIGEHIGGPILPKRLGEGGWYLLSLLTFALGLTAKPMLVTLPCVLLLLDYWPLRRFGVECGRGALTPRTAGILPASPPGPSAPQPFRPPSFGLILLEKLPFFALVAASSWITYHYQSKSGAVTAALSLNARLANAIVSIPRYLGKFFWPVDLAVLYPHPGTWPPLAICSAALLVAVVTIAACFQFCRRPWLVIGWLWFLGMLVPVSGIVQVGLQSMADRYTYLPIVGLQIAVLWSLREVLTGFRSPACESGDLRPLASPKPWRRRVRLLPSAIGLLLGLIVLTSAQLRAWKNSLTLFTHTIAIAGQNNYLAYDNRGIALQDAGRVDEAVSDFERALAIRPDYPNANNNLGRVLADRGQVREAIEHYRTALRVQPDLLEIHNNLANALSDAGQIDEAIQHYQFVLQREPNHVNALNGYAVALATKGSLAEAEQQFRAVLRLDPANVSALSNLGNVCAMQGRHEEAVTIYRQALVAHPDDPRTLLNLGNVLFQQGQFAIAADNLRRAIALAPVNPDAHATLGLVLTRLGQRDEAIAQLQIALQQRPDFPQARAWLAAAMGAPSK